MAVNLCRIALLGLLTCLAGPASGTSPRAYAFDALLDGKPIGRQTFEVRGGDAERLVSIAADFEVRFLSFTVYAYRHRNREVWRDGCLWRIDAETDDAGTRSRVRGARSDRGFVVTGETLTETMDDCVWSFAYWDPRILSRDRLLNSQTGAYEAVRARFVEDEPLEVMGRTVPARRYLLEGETFRMELWYGPDDEWLGLASRTTDGRVLRLVRSNG
jgi:hypothetical protein